LSNISAITAVNNTNAKSDISSSISDNSAAPTPDRPPDDLT
jgi:hypothetical protein